MPPTRYNVQHPLCQVPVSSGTFKMNKNPFIVNINLQGDY
ncbi:hypothetical protein CSB69_3738 [Morganella morganii]|nr:hypothetical protein CSB69_3738 [Morganella morganii]EMP51794.1 hypothetical protein C790_00693 [Morganella morganii SC01]